MRIVIDLQGAQTESRFRGIGRYSLGFAKGVLQNCEGHEVIIILNGLFPETIEPLRAEFEGMLPSENILVWHAPGPVREMDPANTQRRKTAEVIREAFIANLNPDIVHVTSLFEGFIDDAVTSIGLFDSETPVSVTAHDLIPFINPHVYLNHDPKYGEFYHRKIDQFKNASCYTSVSEHSLLECAENIDRPNYMFKAVLGGVDNYFKPVSYDNRKIHEAISKIGVEGEFLLCVGGVDERKNIPRLIQAFAKLPKSVLDGHSLVLAGRMSDGEIADFELQARRAGLPSEKLRFVGYVSDDQLVLLYNICALYILPSWHEGFGLPAAEAMACGAPVVGANTSSLPEVIGDSRALFDPYDVSSIANKIAELLTDEKLRDELRRHGIQQARKFNWSSTAEKSIKFWEEIISGEIGNRSGFIKNKNRINIYDNLIMHISRFLFEENDEFIIDICKCIAKNEKEIFSLFGARVSERDLSWRIEGPFDSSYSLALINREIARSLAEQGVQVALFSTEGPGDFAPSLEFLNKNDDLASMSEQAGTLGHDQVSVVSRILYPPRVHDMTARCNLLHSYAWEESAFPMEWVRQFNQHLDGITCLSEHVRKVLRDNGVFIPLAVGGCGVDHWERVTASANCVLDNMNAKPFRFLHVSSFFPRKGPDALLKAWCAAFSDTDDVCLIIKTFPNPHNQVHEKLSDLRGKYPDAAPIIVIEDDMSDSDLKALYERCQILVAPSYAEGFCLPIAEAMLSGIPAITTRWSGPLDFCTPDNSWLVDYEFEQADTHLNLRPSAWAKIDEKALVSALKTAYDTTTARRAEMACHGRELLLANFSWSKVAERLVEFSQNLYSTEFVRPAKVGWISTWNEKCGIAVYSRHLMSNFERTPIILAAHADELTEPDGSNCIRCWTAGDVDEFSELTATVENAHLDTLVIQFNFSFFDHTHIFNFLKFHKAAGRTIVFEMHATENPPQAPDKKLENYVPALALCDKVLVHSINDMNLLKQLGLVENVTLFPVGVLEVEDLKQDPLPTATVATYGFCLPHKGLQQIVEAIGLLRDEGDHVALRMVNAEYPIDTSADLIGELTDRIAELKLEDRITLESRFLPDNESLSLLQAVDLVVFAYAPTSESASAAARYGLASGRPTIVTDISIFHEFGDAVWRVKDTEPRNLADAMRNAIKEIRTSSSEYYAKQEASQIWREQHSFAWLSERLEGMIRGLHIDKHS